VSVTITSLIADSSSPLRRIDHDELLHDHLVDRPAMRLDHEGIAPTHRLEETHMGLAGREAADLHRTSPAAKTPGTLVSNTKGLRERAQRGSSFRARSSWPMMTNPLSSRAISGPSQSVRGEAPMKTKSQFAGTSAWVPAAMSAIVMASR
jgi:hypothetical protein